MADLTERMRIVVKLPADRVAVAENEVLVASWCANDPTVVTVSVARRRKLTDAVPIEVWNGEVVELDFSTGVGGVIQRDLVEDAVRRPIEEAQRDPEEAHDDIEIEVSDGWAAWYVGDWLLHTPSDEWPTSAAEAVETAARDKVLLIGDFKEALEHKRRDERDDDDD